MVGRTLHEGIIRILIHQTDLIGICPRALLLRLAPVPQPRRIHMGMSDEARIRSRFRILLRQHLPRNHLCPADSLTELLRIRILIIIIYYLMNLLLRILHLGPLKIILPEYLRHFVQNP